MKTHDIPKAHPELLDALHRQDEQAQQMKLSEGFTEKVMKTLPPPSLSGRGRSLLTAVATPTHNDNCSIPQERTGEESRRWVFRIAAIFLAAAFLGGLSFAAYRVFAPQTNSLQPKQVTTPLPHREGSGGGSIRFSNIRLDSILTVVSAHYGKHVCFRNEEPRGMKLITTWNPKDSLATFIEHLNMFDCLHLTLQDDTIFVEQTIEEDQE